MMITETVEVTGHTIKLHPAEIVALDIWFDKVYKALKGLEDLCDNDGFTDVVPEALRKYCKRMTYVKQHG